jgi:hypothetical protein
VVFILSSVLKYEFGLPALYDAAQPVLASLGLNQSLGWNINLMIVFGPLLALLLNVIGVVSLSYGANNDDVRFQIVLKKATANWMIIILGGLCMAALFTYLLMETTAVTKR